MDLLAFLAFFYLLCIPGLPFALVLAISVFPHLLWLAPDRIVLVGATLCSLVVFSTALLIFAPSKGFIRRWWDHFTYRVKTSTHRRFRVWAGMMIGLVAVSAAALPLAIVWLGLRLLLTEKVLQLLMCCTSVAVLPAFFWLFWVAIVLGRPHPYLARQPFAGAMLVRMQLSFVDGIERIRTPAAAERDRKRILKAAGPEFVIPPTRSRHS